MSIPLFTDDMRKYIHLLPVTSEHLNELERNFNRNNIIFKALNDLVSEKNDAITSTKVIEININDKVEKIKIDNLPQTINVYKGNISNYKLILNHYETFINMYKDIEIIKSNQVRITSICEHLENKIADNEQNLNVTLDEIKKEVKFYRFMIVGLIILVLIK